MMRFILCMALGLLCRGDGDCKEGSSEESCRAMGNVAGNALLQHKKRVGTIELHEEEEEEEKQIAKQEKPKAQHSPAFVEKFRRAVNRMPAARAKIFNKDHVPKVIEDIVAVSCYTEFQECAADNHVGHEEEGHDHCADELARELKHTYTELMELHIATHHPGEGGGEGGAHGGHHGDAEGVDGHGHGGHNHPGHGGHEGHNHTAIAEIIVEHLDHLETPLGTALATCIKPKGAIFVPFIEMFIERLCGMMTCPHDGLRVTDLDAIPPAMALRLGFYESTCYDELHACEENPQCLQIFQSKVAKIQPKLAEKVGLFANPGFEQILTNKSLLLEIITVGAKENIMDFVQDVDTDEGFNLAVCVHKRHEEILTQFVEKIMGSGVSHFVDKLSTPAGTAEALEEIITHGTCLDEYNACLGDHDCHDALDAAAEGIMDNETKSTLAGLKGMTPDQVHLMKDVVLDLVEGKVDQVLQLPLPSAGEALQSCAVARRGPLVERLATDLIHLVVGPPQIIRTVRSAIERRTCVVEIENCLHNTECHHDLHQEFDGVSMEMLIMATDEELEHFFDQDHHTGHEHDEAWCELFHCMKLKLPGTIQALRSMVPPPVHPGEADYDTCEDAAANIPQSHRWDYDCGQKKFGLRWACSWQCDCTDRRWKGKGKTKGMFPDRQGPWCFMRSPNPK